MASPKILILSGNEVYPFLQSQPTTIVYVGPGAGADDVPAVFRGRFLYWREPPIPIVVVDSTKVSLSSTARTMTNILLSRIGMKLDGSGKPPTGYYLFEKTQPVKFHSATPDIDTDQKAIFIGLLGAVADLAIEKDVFSRIGAAVMNSPGAQRAADIFEEYLRNVPPPYTRQHRSKSTTQAAAETRLMNAYETLGLTRSATDEDVLSAHKRLVMANHPDRCQGDAAAIAEATRRTSEINVARDIILGRPR